MGSLNVAADEGVKRVLLVDDDEALLRVTARVLAQPGFQITCANSGAQATTQLATQSFDVIVSDVHMPGMTGIQLLRSVREHDADVQVVLITGRPEVSSAAAAVEYGAFQYLSKPVSSDRLCSVVKLAVDASRAARIKREFVEQFGSGTFRVGDRAGVDAALDRALASLWMAYQPIVRCHSHELFACEALLRSTEPALPSPGAVLQAAQRTERLLDVGRAVRARVASDLQSVADQDGVCLFVNLHADDLADPALTAPDSPLSLFAPQIVLEVTERSSLDSVAHLPERIAQLRGLGFRIALDDLGAGYAGLSSLTQLEPEFVKLDMSLVRDAHESKVKQRLIRAVVDLCHDMGKQVIAEGVETVTEQATLEALKCDYLQGYLFARPQRGLPRGSGKLAARAG